MRRSKQKKNKGEALGAYAPKKLTKQRVKAMILTGADLDAIRRTVIDPATASPLSKEVFNDVFKNEIDFALLECNGQVIMSMFMMAVGRPARYDKSGRLIQSETKAQFSAAKWWLETVAGMKQEDGGATAEEFGRMVATVAAQMRGK